MIRPMVRRPLFFTAFLLIVGFAHADTLPQRLLAPDAATRQTAIGELVKLDLKQKRETLLALIPWLKTDAVTAERASDALGSMGGYADAAVPALVEALHFDEDSVFKAVGSALQKIGPVSVGTLERATGDASFIVRRRVAEILGQFGPKAAASAPALVRLLQDPQFDVHSAAETALSGMGESAIPAVTSGLHGADDQFRRSLVTLLGKLGPSAAPTLVEELHKDENPFVRGSAAEALGELKGAEAIAVGALIDAFGDLDEGVRGSIADALGNLGPAAKASLGILITASRTDKEALVQQKSKDAVAKIGGASAASIAALIKALHSDDAGVRQDVVKSLGSPDLSAKDALPLLNSASTDGDADVRLAVAEAAEVLVQKDRASVFPVIQRLTKDPSDAVRRKAADLQKKLGGGALPSPQR